MVHAVCAVESQQLGDGADGMRRVGISPVKRTGTFNPVVGGIVGHMPHALRGEIVDVGSFAVGDLSEESLTMHFEHLEVEHIVAAVLCHEAVALRPFGCGHQLAALLNRCGSRHFHGHVFAVVHGIDGHFGMRVPFGADVHEVDVRPFAGFLPGFRATKGIGFRTLASAELFCSQFKPLRIGVDYAADGGMGDAGVADKGFHAPFSESHKGYAHRRDGRALEEEGRLWFHGGGL